MLEQAGRQEREQLEQLEATRADNGSRDSGCAAHATGGYVDCAGAGATGRYVDAPTQTKKV